MMVSFKEGNGFGEEGELSRMCRGVRGIKYIWENAKILSVQVKDFDQTKCRALPLPSRVPRPLPRSDHGSSLYSHESLSALAPCTHGTRSMCSFWSDFSDSAKGFRDAPLLLCVSSILLLSSIPVHEYTTVSLAIPFLNGYLSCFQFF